MGYTTDDLFVRVDFFKPSGKWYCTESLKWKGYRGLIHDEFKSSLKNHLKYDKERLSGMTAVCPGAGQAPAPLPAPRRVYRR